MASISELKARLSFFVDDKGLKAFENRLRISGQRLTMLGDQLSMSLSAPLALFGAAAVKSAGDIESLRLALETTMQDAGRSTEDARMELEALRKAALAPGLDFEQAVQGSIRLQNVGFSAERSRETIVELANAVAMAGGSAEQLDGVTRQFSQMISKGRILQEDLTIIQENMPSITKAMQEAFGTANAERLREMGVNADQFVNAITRQLKTLPRVSGGIKNSIVNAGSAIKNFMATIGEEINKVFDLGGASDMLSKKLGELANWFKALDDDTKRMIVKFGLAVVAAGPLIKVFGTLRLAGAQMISVYRSVVQSVSALPGSFNAAKASFASFNTIVKASVIGVAIAAIAVAVQEFNASMERANAVARVTEKVNKDAADSISREKTQINLLVDELKDENASREQKRKALNELKKINPQYFGQLTEETAKTGLLTESVDAYVESALRAARAKSALIELEAVDRQLSNLGETVAENSTFLEKVSLALLHIQDELFGTNKAVYKYLGTLDREKAVLLEKQKALKNIIKENGGAAESINLLNDEYKNFLSTLNNGAGPIKDTSDELSVIIDRLLAMNEQAAKAEAGELMRIFQEQGGVMTPLNIIPKVISEEDPFIAMNENLKAYAATMSEVATPAFQSFSSKVTDGMIAAIDAFEAFGLSIANSLDQGAVSFMTFARSAVQAIGKVISMLIKEAVAFAVAGAFRSSGNPLVGAALASVGGALAASLFNRLVSGATASFAAGGIVSGPTLGLVGEYSGARSNPEVIAPLDRLKSILEPGMGGGTLTTRVSGKDLLIVLEGAQKDARRARGF